MGKSGVTQVNTAFFLKALTQEYHAFRGHNVGTSDAASGEDAVLEGKILDFQGFVQVTCQSSLEAFFEDMDSAGSGVVHRSQFVKVLQDKGYKGDPYDIWKLLNPDGDGYAGRQAFAHLEGPLGRTGDKDVVSGKRQGPRVEIKIRLKAI